MSFFKKVLTAAMVGGLSFCSTLFADNVKIAFIEPLSGPYAASGSQGLAQFKFVAEDQINKKGGVLGGKNFEIVGFDNKLSAKEAVIQVEVAIDQGIRFIAQGNSSGIANAITDHVKKHNKRNPDKRVLFINYSAVDPALTNDKCNFWHFRFDANADNKMDAITDVIAGESDIKKMYLIGQDYSFGKAVAAAAEKYLGEKTSIEIVGNELHPISKVQDFTPYARKIMASGADAVITGNWGADMLNLGKSLTEAGYKGPIYCYYCFGVGITSVFGEDGVGMLKAVGEGFHNPAPSDEFRQFHKRFKAKYPDNDFDQPRVINALSMLAMAIDKAGTADDVVAVAKALEGMTFDSKLLNTKVYMRPQDHQAIQNLHIGDHSSDVEFDMDNSGYGMKIFKTVEMASMDSPTTCKMKRP